MITSIFPAMGGEVEVQLVDGGVPEATGIRRLFAAYEHAMTRFRDDSELSRMNQATGPFAASSLLFDAVRTALQWARATDCVFDPTILDTLEAHGYDRPFELLRSSGATAVATAPPNRTAAQRSWRAVVLNDERRTIDRNGARIDLGGIGKGFTVDAAARSLGAAANAMVNASGDLYAAGEGPDGEGWRVGVQDPFDPAEDVAILRVRDRGVATSGTAKRHWSMGDARYHHLIDTREHSPSASGLLTVTVIAATATAADVLAKTAFLLGPAEGIACVKRFGAECVAISRYGDVMMSSGIKEYLA
jgi:thiamine biosynthesis lipoprotein